MGTPLYRWRDTKNVLTLLLGISKVCLRACSSEILLKLHIEGFFVEKQLVSQEAEEEDSIQFSVIERK